jgi:hypothetical protein
VAVAALSLVQFMDVLGVTVVVTSLPAMLASLHAPDSYGSLIATGYAMFFGAAWSAAGASGFVVGGIVTDLASWRFIFWAYLPLSAALAAVIAASVPPDGARRQAESLNLAGSGIFTAAVMAFVVGTTLIAQSGGRVTGGGLLLAACLVLPGASSWSTGVRRRCCRRS